MNKLTKKYGDQVKLYKNLPKHYQIAIAFYMSIDADNWEFPTTYWKEKLTWGDKFEKYLMNVVKRNLKKHYIKKYGNKKIGVVEMPTNVVVQKIIEAGYPNPRIKTKEDYIEWTKKFMDVPNHPKTNRFPCLLNNNGVLFDGHSRFSCYLLRGDENIPCVYFP
jgi:hypothetical protein